MVGERGFEPPTPWSRTKCKSKSKCFIWCRLGTKDRTFSHLQMYRGCTEMSFRVQIRRLVEVVRTPRGGFGLGCRWRYGRAPSPLRSFRRLSHRRTKHSKSGFDLVFSSKRPVVTEAEAGRAPGCRSGIVAAGRG